MVERKLDGEQKESETGAELDESTDLEGPSSSGSSSGVPPSLRERYEDLWLIGEGGMGTVYRGRDVRLCRMVALKLLRRVEPELSRRLLQEARAQARVQHELVCRVYEVGEADGEPFIAMQYIEGEPLDLAKGHLKLEQKVKLLREVAGALHEAHRSGLIHRDVKPGNILVETREDGALRPYIVDFGLAREATAEGQTTTGAVVGTPAYMAPEQARGEVRALDRRTDIYSLGATLYDVLSGHPPFVAEHPWKLLARVADEEAPALRTAMKQVPGDLETIVMKCLEREPARRYDSAKALGEDLQRFLDGEPILARRSSLRARVGRTVRKHKLALALGGAALLAAAVPLGVWVDARREAAAQVALARELAGDVKEMELFMGRAYELPLHDVERERDVVRARLGRIERTMAAAGKPGEAAGHYALGRGYLTLEDPQKAREHLERALAEGYRSPDLEVALGMALGEIYRKALEDTRRIDDEKERAAKVREVEAQVRDPALAHLRAGQGASLESPAYAEGLIAFYEGKHDEALAKAKEAFEKAPWLYEAKKLEGDVQVALGNPYRHDAAYDEDKQNAHFGPAAEAYRTAAEIARSDPEAHRAECELFTQIMMGVGSAGKPVKPTFEKAKAACARAVAASSKDARARVQQAFAHSMFAGILTEWATSGDDPRAPIKEAIDLAEEAVRASPEDPMAHYVLGSVWGDDAIWARDRGYDGRASFQRSIAACEEALRLDPRFVWALQQLLSSHYLSLEIDLWEGRDPGPGVERATKVAERLMAVASSSPYAWFNKGNLHYVAAEELLPGGQSPEKEIALMLSAAGEIERLSPDTADAYLLRLMAHTLMATHEIAAGKDPRRSLGEAARQAEEVKKRDASSASNQLEIGTFLYAEALYRFDQSEDPEPVLGDARETFRQASEASPWNVDILTRRAQVEILAIRWASKHRRAKPEMFEGVMALLRPHLSEQLRDSRVYQVLADLHAQRAAWLAEQGRSPAADIAEGLSICGKALSINPRMATALATKATLYLTQARAARDPASRAEAARLADKAFQEAFQSNPLLEREHGASRKEAASLR